MASQVCCTLFHDPHVTEGPGEEHGRIFHCTSGRLVLEALQFEPLIVAIIFPFSHVSSYTEPWAVKGAELGEYFHRALQEGFKQPGAGPQCPRGDSGPTPAARGDPRQLHVMDKPLPGVFSNPEAGSRALLWKLLASVGKLPPMQECLVRRVLQGVPKRQLPQAGPPSKRVRPGS